MKFHPIILPVIGYVLAVGFNLPHLVSVHPATSLPGWYVWAMFGVIDLGILILALREKEIESQIFAWCVFLLNLFFYWGHIPFPSDYYEAVQATPGLILSAIPAYFVFYFSEIISETIQERKRNDAERLENDALITANDKLRIEILNLEGKIEAAEIDYEYLEKENNQKQKQIESLTFYKNVVTSLQRPTRISKTMSIVLCERGHVVPISNSSKSHECKLCKTEN